MKPGGAHFILVIAAVFMLCALAVPGYLLYAIKEAKAYSHIVAEDIALRRESEERERKERQLLVTTEKERAYLFSRVVTTDTVSLLITALERAGTDAGVRLEVGSVDRISTEGSIDVVMLSARASGTFAQLFTLVRLLEQLPYASRIESATLERREGGSWEVTVFIRSALREV